MYIFFFGLAGFAFVSALMEIFTRKQKSFIFVSLSTTVLLVALAIVVMMA